jgi:cytochrome c
VSRHFGRAVGLTAAATTAAVVTVVIQGPGPARADGDADRGAEQFQKHCAACHSLRPDHHLDGPSLHGVFGRRAGTAPFYGRYAGLRGADVVWTEATLDAWLADPRGFLPNGATRMTYAVADRTARADVIAFLKAQD